MLVLLNTFWSSNFFIYIFQICIAPSIGAITIFENKNLYSMSKKVIIYEVRLGSKAIQVQQIRFERENGKENENLGEVKHQDLNCLTCSE